MWVDVQHIRHVLTVQARKRKPDEAKSRRNLPSTRHTLAFDLPVSADSNRKYPNKTEQKQVILDLRALGWSYREIAEEVGIHWTRVGQIVRQTDKE
jgi:DNA-binding NarL/FixJ family response regulator